MHAPEREAEVPLVLLSRAGIADATPAFGRLASCLGPLPETFSAVLPRAHP